MFRLRIVLLVVFGGLLTVAGLMLVSAAMPDGPGRPFAVADAVAAGSAPPSGRIRFAVLGDSDSQSYHDTQILSNPGARGGAWRATTWQWTEVLARLRGDQLDLGEWGLWGSGKYRARFDRVFGVVARTPPKDDYRYDFAVSGAWCNQLLGTPQRQAVNLVDLMDNDPQAWKGGIVLIRIGINDVGGHGVLDELARDPTASHPISLINGCVDAIGETVALIHKRHPQTNVVLVGVLNNADWAVEFDSWQSAQAIANIEAGMDVFDNGLRKIAADNRHVTFLNDRAWFRSLWGARDDQGRPIYKTVRLSPGWAITNSSGDDPHNSVLADGHAGVVWNTLWAQHLVASLNAAFGLHLTPITDAEVVGFLEPSFAAKHQ
jgi:hypothetical protein